MPKKKPKRRVIEHKPVPKTSKQKIQDIKDDLAWLDEVEDRLIKEQQDADAVS